MTVQTEFEVVPVERPGGIYHAIRHASTGRYFDWGYSAPETALLVAQNLSTDRLAQWSRFPPRAISSITASHIRSMRGAQA